MDQQDWYDLFEDVAATLKHQRLTREQQHKELARIVYAERERCAAICEGMKTRPPGDDPEDVERGYNAALRRAAERIRGA
jgi:hypothetical protein